MTAANLPPDLDAIQALEKFEDLAENGTMRPEDRRDMSALLALVREQQAQIGRVEDLCNSWDRMATTDNTQDATLRATVYAIRAALTATPNQTKETTMHEHNDTVCNNPDTLCADCTNYGAQDAATEGA